VGAGRRRRPGQGTAGGLLRVQPDTLTLQTLDGEVDCGAPGGVPNDKWIVAGSGVGVYGLGAGAYPRGRRWTYKRRICAALSIPRRELYLQSRREPDREREPRRWPSGPFPRSSTAHSPLHLQP
jgi:hypothetical protein